ncbi:hypothetical protein KSF73_06385 [Burkholderiaceae bacterium DAT-1]|nr:hypothetical protein [Burkholderiaceae bacterium DAT-1]
MNVHVGNGASQAELAKYLLGEIELGTDLFHLKEKIALQYALSEEDALLAIDRVQGGIIRALTGNPENAPDRLLDPIAKFAFDAVWKTLQRKHFLSRKRIAGGKWESWYVRHRSSNSD